MRRGFMFTPFDIYRNEKEGGNLVRLADRFEKFKCDELLELRELHV